MKSTGRRKKLRTGLTLAAAAGIAALAFAGIQSLRRQFALAEADKFLKQGFGNLAAEAVEPVRFSLTKDESSCAILLQSYYVAHQAERLGWAAESCLSHGIENPDIYIGYAASHELQDRSGVALRILEQGLEKFGKSANIYQQMAMLYRHDKQDQLAVQAYLKAAELAPQNNQLTLEAMSFLMSQQKYPEARALADRLRYMQTEDPAVKLLLARAYRRAGERKIAQDLMEQGQSLLARAPDKRMAIEKAFEDVLKGEDSPEARGPAAQAQQPDMPSAPPNAPPMTKHPSYLIPDGTSTDEAVRSEAGQIPPLHPICRPGDRPDLMPGRNPASYPVPARRPRKSAAAVAEVRSREP